MNSNVCGMMYHVVATVSVSAGCAPPHAGLSEATEVLLRLTELSWVVEHPQHGSVSLVERIVHVRRDELTPDVLRVGRRCPSITVSLSGNILRPGALLFLEEEHQPVGAPAELRLAMYTPVELSAVGVREVLALRAGLRNGNSRGRGSLHGGGSGRRSSSLYNAGARGRSLGGG